MVDRSSLYSGNFLGIIELLRSRLYDAFLADHLDLEIQEQVPRPTSLQEYLMNFSSCS